MHSGAYIHKICLKGSSSPYLLPFYIWGYKKMNWVPEVQRASFEGQPWLASPIWSVCACQLTHPSGWIFPLAVPREENSSLSEARLHLFNLLLRHWGQGNTWENISVPWQSSQKAVPYQELHFLSPLHLWHLQMMSNKNANYSDPSNSKFEKIYYRCDLGYSQSFALSSKSIYLTSYWGKT